MCGMFVLEVGGMMSEFWETAAALHVREGSMRLRGTLNGVGRGLPWL